MKAYTQKDSLENFKISVASSYANIAVNTSDISKAKDVLKQIASPFNKTQDAVLETSKGFITGVDSIIRYFGNIRPDSYLYGDSIFDKSQVDMWLQFSNQVENDKDNASIQSKLETLDQFLLNCTYLVGHNVTIADISLVTTLKFKSIETTKFTNVERWVNTITQQKQYTKVSPKDESSKNSKAASKKETSTNAAPKEAAKDEKEEDIGVLQLSIMNKWKKFYSNSKQKHEEVMPWFWTQEEITQNFSLWLMKYNKLPNECKLDFITCNMLNGFMQRVPNTIREDSFGMIHVLGVKDDYDIQGVWLFKGDEIPADMKDHPSFEYNFFEKLDFNSEADQKMVTDYWCNTETIQGRPVIDTQPWK